MLYRFPASAVAYHMSLYRRKLVLSGRCSRPFRAVGPFYAIDRKISPALRPVGPPQGTARHGMGYPMALRHNRGVRFSYCCRRLLADCPADHFLLCAAALGIVSHHPLYQTAGTDQGRPLYPHKRPVRCFDQSGHLSYPAESEIFHFPTGILASALER